MALAALLLAAGLACGGSGGIAFVSERDGGGALYIADADDDGGEPALLAGSGRAASGPVWAPDGETLAYVSAQGGRRHIVISKSNGEETRLISPPDASAYAPWWGPEGKRLAYISDKGGAGRGGSSDDGAGRGGQPEVYVFDLEQERHTRITDSAAAERLGGWSPDGEWLALYGMNGFERGLWLRNPQGVNLLRLTDGDDAEPVWSPDGRLLAFTRTAAGVSNIYAVRQARDGGWTAEAEVVALTDTARNNHSPAFAPDGDAIAFVSERDGTAEIYLMEEDGSNQRRLTTNQVPDGSPVWSPDGQRIAFVSEMEGAGELFVMQADGSEQRRLTFDGVHDHSPDW